MERIIEKLEQMIESMGLTVLDRRNDGFTYAVAIQHKKGVFVIYTTKGIYHYRLECSFRLLQTSEHLPFAEVEPWIGGDFVIPYIQAVTSSGKCIANYWHNFRVEDLPHTLESAAGPL